MPYLANSRRIAASPRTPLPDKISSLIVPV